MSKLGFKGAMLHGLANDVFLDDKRFWPIYERAQALDVPIYLHPSLPLPAVMDAYYNDYAKDFPMVARAARHGGDRDPGDPHGAQRRVRRLSAAENRARPSRRNLPFLVWRVDHALARPGAKTLSFRDAFCSHFYVTTSGNFSNPALLCCVMELGIDRILFSVDWPFVANMPAVKWIKTVPLSDEDKVKLLSGNAKRLFRM